MNMISAYAAPAVPASRCIAAAGETRRSCRRLWAAVAGWACILALLACLAPFAAVRAQETPAPPPLSPAQLEQLVAPIALYPDSLLSQVLMASTYPLEVVEAQRWRSSQPRRMSDQQLSLALQNSPWDPSVQSLAAFPEVLQMMSDRLEWTQQLGEAFLSQQEDLMSAVQRLRARAQAAGHLQSTAQQTVQVVQGPSPIIEIIPAQPELVYVPVYDPLVVYGAWPYPAYRPFYWHPPSFLPPPGVFISFGAGLLVGHALWGHMDWHRRVVRIDVDRYNRYNHAHIVSPNWVHHVEHRRGVHYDTPALRERYGRGPGGPAFHGGPGPAGSAARPPIPGRGPGPQTRGQQVHGPQVHGPQTGGPQTARPPALGPQGPAGAHAPGPHGPELRRSELRNPELRGSGAHGPGASGPHPEALGARPPGRQPFPGRSDGGAHVPFTHNPAPAARPASPPVHAPTPQVHPSGPAVHGGGMPPPHRGPERAAQAPRPAVNHPPQARQPEGGHGNGGGGGHGGRHEERR